MKENIFSVLELGASKIVVGIVYPSETFLSLSTEPGALGVTADRCRHTADHISK